VVGDRLDTDIEAANRAGADSLLVLTGVSRPAELVIAPPELRPTYVALALDALLEPYPDVIPEDAASDMPRPAGGGAPAGDGFACNGWTARWSGGGQPAITLGAPAGSAGPVDGLRALCAAAWSRPGTSGGAVSAALAQLTAAGLRS
jgi:hypothetical protein